MSKDPIKEFNKEQTKLAIGLIVILIILGFIGFGVVGGILYLIKL